MNFNLSATTGAKEAGSVLSAGIHNATFKGIVKDGNSAKKQSKALFDSEKTCIICKLAEVRRSNKL